MTPSKQWSNNHADVQLSHPGRSLKRDCIDSLGLTIAEAAECLGVSRLTLSKVVNERGEVTPELAIHFGKMKRGRVDNWFAMHQAHDLAKARKQASWIKVKPCLREPVLA